MGAVDAEELAGETAESSLHKRAVCSNMSKYRFVMCMSKIPQQMARSGIFQTGWCNVRSHMQTEMVKCANSAGCGSDRNIDRAIKRGMDNFDGSMRKNGVNPSSCRRG